MSTRLLNTTMICLVMLCHSDVYAQNQGQKQAPSSTTVSKYEAQYSTSDPNVWRSLGEFDTYFEAELAVQKFHDSQAQDDYRLTRIREFTVKVSNYVPPPRKPQDAQPPAVPRPGGGNAQSGQSSSPHPSTGRSGANTPNSQSSQPGTGSQSSGASPNTVTSIRKLPPSREDRQTMKAELDQQRAQISKEEQEFEQRRSNLNSILIDARNEKSEASSMVNEMQSDLANAKAKWSTANFNRCPNGNSWEECDHEEEKQSWLDDANREISPAKSRLDKAKAALKNAEDKATKTKQEYDVLKTKKAELESRTSAIVQKARIYNNGGSWLNPSGGASPLTSPITNPAGSTTGGSTGRPIYKP